MKIKRSIYGKLLRELAEPQVLVLVGPRQVGKTTLMRRLESDARAAGHRTRYLDLEQPSDLAFLQGQAAEVIESLTGNVDLVFVDEFYYLEDAGRLTRPVPFGRNL